MDLPFEQSQRRDNSTTIQQQATKQDFKGRPKAVLPAAEVEAVLSDLPRMT
jgi:hypothetical protein